MKKIYFTLLMSCLFFRMTAQEDSSTVNKPKIDISGFIEAYYSYDFSEPNLKHKQPFLYNYNRHNEFNVNIALLRASISYKNVYGKVSVHAGTYVDDNYANETVKLLNEAFVGVYLDQSMNTSIEAGIMPSYIGFETATSHSNLTVTRSILAENSPYFMTGVKLNHQFNNKFSGSFLVTNGWQRIQKVNNKLAPSFGSQLVYKASEKSAFNWSTFLGEELVNTSFKVRYFSNLFWDYTWNEKWRTILGFDYGIQDLVSGNDDYGIWYSPVLITQYKLNPKWNLAYRMEYYQDKKNVIIASGLPFEVLGNSLNLDFLPNSKCKIRTEGKWYRATEKNFDEGTKKDNFSVTTTMSFEF